MTPTAEQDRIIQTFLANHPMVIEAGAGTGKSSTLKMLAAASPRRNGLYIAYNKAIADESAASFPPNVRCRTMHSLAFRSTGSKYKHRLNSARMTAKVVAQLLDIDSYRGSVTVPPARVAGCALSVIAKFCNSGETELRAWMVPLAPVLGRSGDTKDFQEHVLSAAQLIWEDVVKLDGKLPFTHDNYLKIWALSNPTLPGDFVLLDEAQDANPVIADVFQRQEKQLILVGDECQPPGTLVTVVQRKAGEGEKCSKTVTSQVPIEEITVGDTVLSYDLNKAYLRRGGSAVSGITVRRYNGTMTTIKTEGGRTSRYTNDHHCIVRLSAATTISAVNLLDGMQVLTVDGAMDAQGRRVAKNKWESITVSRESYDGPVYSMTVDRDHTYVGDGIITHNCQAIYGWRDAQNIMTGFPGVRRRLSQSFRFGDKIAKEANKWLYFMGSTLLLTGNPAVTSVVRENPRARAVLCRTNAGCLLEAINAQADGKDVAIVGGGEHVKRLAYALEELRIKGRTNHPEFSLFTSWSDLVSYAEEEDSSGLLVLIKLIKANGVALIARTVDHLVGENAADLIISTAHKAKGREWDSVRIGNDYFTPESEKSDSSEGYDEETGERYAVSRKKVPESEDKALSLDELKLAYVSITRAKCQLDRGSLAWIDSHVKKKLIKNGILPSS